IYIVTKISLYTKDVIILKRRVVITGTGVITPLGNETNTLWENIKQGQPVIKRLDSKNFQDIKTKIAGYIEDFQGEKYMDRKETRRYDLFTQYAYAASVQALAESGLILEKLNKD